MTGKEGGFLERSSNFLETFKSPRPVPTSMSGLVIPWKSLPPVTNRASRLAKSRSLSSVASCAYCSGLRCRRGLRLSML